MRSNLMRFAGIVALPLVFLAFLFINSCEGPRGPAGADGKDGTNGTNGTDANETCKTCHNPNDVDRIKIEFQFSKHEYGEAAFEEAGNTSCAVCHTQQGFLYVVQNNVPSTFTLNAGTGKYSNNYATISSQALGEIGCGTCHASTHTTYGAADTVLTTNAAVAMTMWKGNKTINLAQDNGRSNLCIKCHQPRPMTKSTTLSNGDIVNYDSLALDPNRMFYDSTTGASNTHTYPSYRMHVHYGVVGAVFAGMGGVEFTGSKTVQSSTHTSVASCQDCHMATVSGRGGGHTFMVQGNFNGCNTSGCHTGVSSSNSTLWTNPRNTIKGLLNTLATKINAAGGGTPILHADSDTETNLWAGLTTGNWDGYLNIYDPSSNPGGAWRNPNPSGSWTQAQKDANLALPKFPSLKYVQVGAMINFQFALREASLGIHNYKYSEALLTNTIEKMTDAGF
ncbi:MAG TPA: hypothetical protein PKV06_11920 [bacterium]|nr:hypothetical protein [bacterium]HMY36650.1 hypothetical protein [bacterium]HNB10216.1 hypothetical protein [bacterium]HNB57668.1 hypothetical protein [bacterium]HNH34096.1 hypothetical protein [bacterium]